MDNKQAANKITECLLKLESAEIGLDNAFVAIRLAGDMFACTPPAADLSNISAEDILLIDSVKLQAHNKTAYTVFAANTNINAVILNHSHFCRLAALEGRDIPPVLDDMAQIVGVYAKVCDIRNVKKLTKLLKKNSACLSTGSTDQDYGAIATGGTINQAFAAALVLEKSARVYLQAACLGGAEPVNTLEARVMHLGYQLTYSRKADSAKHRIETNFDRIIPEDEMTLRRQLVALGNELSQRNLVQGTWGNMSVRLNQTHMLCTPSGLNYDTITPYDIVRVQISTRKYEGDLKPTGENAIHAALLSAHPQVNCIIHTHPVNCSVFAAAHTKITVPNQQTRALLGGDVEVPPMHSPPPRGSLET